jgi:hypothetical protein
MKIWKSAVYAITIVSCVGSPGAMAQHGVENLCSYLNQAILDHEDKTSNHLKNGRICDAYKEAEITYTAAGAYINCLELLSFDQPKQKQKEFSKYIRDFKNLNRDRARWMAVYKRDCEKSKK